jgi:hypothetical protein
LTLKFDVMINKVIIEVNLKLRSTDLLRFISGQRHMKINIRVRVKVMVLNTTFNKISVNKRTVIYE